MKRMIGELDNFKLSIRDNIDNFDYQIITMLYQPIIGAKATSLYLTLVQEKQLTHRINLDFNHRRLMLLLDFDQYDLTDALERLEIVSLLKTFYNPVKSNYIYQLQKPLGTESFFLHQELQEKLLDKLGSLHFERQKYYFLKDQEFVTEEFINISHSQQSEKSPVFQYQNHVIKNDNPIKSLLASLKPKEEMRIPKSPLPFMESKYQFQARESANLEKQQSVTLDTEKMITKTIALMQSHDSESYLKVLTGYEPCVKLKKTLQLLTFEYNLNKEVINCLLEYVWFKNSKRLEPNYILKIAKTFQENKINDVNGAWDHLKMAYSKSKKTGNYQKNTYQQEVLWTHNDFPKESIKTSLEEPVEQNFLMSQDELNQFLIDFDNY